MVIDKVLDLGKLIGNDKENKSSKRTERKGKDWRYIYFFGELGIEHKDILGGKGAGLSEMKKIGLPIPNGFTITAEMCKYYYDHGKKFPKDFKKKVMDAMHKLEKLSKKTFGKDLLVSVRSGAAISMPGMMDTILNLGLNDNSVKELAKNTKNSTFAHDAYRRLIQMFGNVVFGIPHDEFEKVLQSVKKKSKKKYDYELNVKELQEVIKKYKSIYKKHKKEFPQDPWKQLFLAIQAVFKSWNNERAIVYRRINNIKGLLGTAVNIVEMVFGNMGDDSGTGVAFTRDPNTGENKLYGEFLFNAQGEDVVAGIRTPEPIDALKNELPHVYKQLLDVKKKLEKHFKDMQDIEFTVEKGKLFILQTRNGKRTARAAVKIAVDMVKEKLITKKDAILRITPEQIENLLHPQLQPGKENKHIATGLPASPGGAVGKIVFDPDKAEELAKKEDVILVRPETSAEDIKGMAAAKGILTATGGMTSHAAVVARGMGKPCVVGCDALQIDESKGIVKIELKDETITLKEGDVISIDGSTGKVYLGKAKLVEPELGDDFKTLMKWCDEIKVLGVKANAETPQDIKKALEFGAEGIGLARTEHMFFGERIMAMRKVIFAKDLEERRKALKELLPMQRADFIEFFMLMKNKPVTIRLLDPPLHEFLPKTDLAIRQTAKTLGISEAKVREKIEELHEQNPMLGHRGVRLAITYPEIYGMQVQAIVEAAFYVMKEHKIKPKVQIMIPLVGNYKELEIIKKYLEGIIARMEHDYKMKLDYKIGTMIEVPRAALTADEIAKHAEFFSFGTNDLTQMTLGFSRDDVAKFLHMYIDNEIYAEDPFKTLDYGVKKLVFIAKDLARKLNPKLELGICGEHGGDPKTIEFCHRVGLDYVSCSPFRIPVAKIAAARAALMYKYDSIKGVSEIET